MSAAEADDLIDDITDETSSFGIVDEVVVDDEEGVDDTVDDTVDDEETTDDSTDDSDEEFDCSGPLFSPTPPACQT